MSLAAKSLQRTVAKIEEAILIVVVSHQADRRTLKQNAQRAGDTRLAAHHPLIDVCMGK